MGKTGKHCGKIELINRQKMMTKMGKTNARKKIKNYFLVENPSKK